MSNPARSRSLRFFPSVRRLLPVLLPCLGWLAHAAEVPREASREYRERLAGLLTPRATAIQWTGGEVDKNAPVLTLLDEELQYVDAHGRRIIAEQIVYKALTDAGAKAIAEDVHSYRKSQQKLAVILAETIQPDGAIQSVKDDALLLQSPQRQADYALYDEVMEVRTIFPNVKPGSRVRLVVVTEDTEARMPGEYTCLTSWIAGWPIQRKRFVADLPAELAARLQINVLGDVPAPQRETPGPGRVRLQWERDHIPMGPHDISPAPAFQFGPVTHLTTVAHWQDVGRWFFAMTKERNRLNRTLEGKVDEWTKGLRSPEEIRRVIFEKVANDVRYTGLELGTADYQPHDCNAVWENQYGDCKDKANLLVALLRFKRQEAWVVLLNTYHAGRIDMRSPDYRVFSHAIVAVPDGHGGYLFCDPTIAQSAPGILSGSDMDRDVLIVKDDGVEWARTPLEPVSRAECRFDLKLQPSGDLGGWLTFTTTEFFGSYYAEYYQKLDAIEGKRQMQQFLRSFYPGAELVDFVKPEKRAPAEPYVLRAYFTIRGQKESGARQQTLAFPNCHAWMPNVGESADRQTPFFQHPENFVLTCIVHLPAGLKPVTLPAPLSSDSPGARSSARWTYADGTCTGELTLGVSRTLVQTADFPTYYQSVQGLQTWLDQPLVVSAAGDQPAPYAKPDLADDFPLMPTSEGQFALLEKNFPPTGNVALRRAALDRLLQYYPNDKTATFRAGINLAALDLEAGRTDETVQRIRLLLSAYRADVRADFYAWGQGVLAFALNLKGETEEALGLLQDIADNATLTEEHRAREFVYCADLIKSHPVEKIAGDLRRMARWHTGVQAQIYVLWSHVAFQLNRAGDLRQDLADLVQAGPAAAAELLGQIARQSAWITVSGDAERQQRLLDLLAEQAPRLGPAFAADLNKARQQSGTHQRLAELQSRLRERLAVPALADAYPKVPGHLVVQQDYEQEITSAEAAQNFELCLRLCLQQITTLEADDYYPQRFLRAAAYADYLEKRGGRASDEPALLVLLDVGAGLPADLPAAVEIRLLQAAHLTRKGDPAAAAAVLRELLDRPTLVHAVRPRVILALGKSLEAAGRAPEALKLYPAVEKITLASPEAASALLRAVFLNLHYYNYDEAQRLVRLLATMDPAVRARAEGARAIDEFIGLVSSDQATPYWTQEAGWWPQWEKMAERLALGSAEDPVPVIPDLRVWAQEMGEEFRQGNRAGIHLRIRTQASAARWLPSATLDLADLLSYAPQLSPALGQDFSQLGIALLSPKIEGSPDLLYRRNLLLAVFQFSAQQVGKAQLLIDAMRKLPPSPDPVLRLAFHRVWGMIATASGQGQAEAAKALAADLASPQPNAFRAMTVGILVDLYQAQGMLTEQRELITREVDRPEIKANAALVKFLIGRLDQLSLQAVKPPASADLSVNTPAKLSQVPAGTPNSATWENPKGATPVDRLLSIKTTEIRNTPSADSAKPIPSTTKEGPPAPKTATGTDALRPILPPWYDYVRPADLADPRLRQIDEVLQNPDKFLSRPESIKTYLLVAQDPKFPEETRQSATRMALINLLDLSGRLEDRRRLTRSVLNNPEFDRSIRQGVLLNELGQAATSGRHAEFDQLLATPDAQLLSAAQKTDVDLLAKWLALDRTAPGPLIDLSRQVLAAGPLTQFRGYLLRQLGADLLVTGDTAGVRQWVKELDQDGAATNEGQGVGGLLLEFTKTARLIDQLQPLHTALRDLTLAHFAQLPTGMPAVYQELMPNPWRIAGTSLPDTLGCCVALLRSGRFDRTSLSLWQTLLRNLPQDGSQRDFALALAGLALEKSPTDIVRASVIHSLVGSLDRDDDALRDGITKLLAPYRNPAEPQTYSRIRFLEADNAFRTGAKIEPQTLYAGIDSTSLERQRSYAFLQHYLQQGDKPRLRLQLDNLESGLLNEPYFIALTLPAYELLGLKDEADQARNILRRAVRVAVIRAWAGADDDSISLACTCAEALREPDSLPSAWVQQAEVGMLNHYERFRLLTTDALLRENWPRLLLVSTEAIKEMPANYHYYWLQGLALSRLNRPREAIEPLRTYLRIAHEELDYPRAQALLKRLTSQSE